MAYPLDEVRDIKVRSIPVALWREVRAATWRDGKTVRQFLVDALTIHLKATAETEKER